MTQSSLVHRIAVVFMLLTGTVRTMTAKNTSNGKSSIIFHWFRHGDLRLHDNAALTFSSRYNNNSENQKSNGNDAHVVPIFCFDPTVFGSDSTTRSGSAKCGSKRAKFILDSVTDLRRQLESKCDSQLVVAHGEPAKVFDNILMQMKELPFDVSICVQDEVVQEERRAAQQVNGVLKKHHPQSKLNAVWGSTMYDLKDLPFEESLRDMPDTFTPFRNKVEKLSVIGKPLPVPSKSKMKYVPKEYKLFDVLNPMTSFMPTLEHLGYNKDEVTFAETPEPRGVMEFIGGETTALARVKDYIWDKDCLKSYFDTRNGMLGPNYSTKFSPWLAHGCVSPRHIVTECRRYEAERVANKSTYWVVFELLWRDYCKFFATKHGDNIFLATGTKGSDKKWSTFEKNLEAWKHGRTGYPLVDANMREMLATGFMSNRGRQNVASFLAIDLGHDWRCGGDWFESNLIDYDVYSNWVNWCSAAGMTGGRLNQFNIVKQSKDYDQHGEYVRHWLPELKDVPTQFVHEPWKMTQFQQSEFNVRLGVDYPNPIIPPTRPNRGGRSDGDGRQKKQGQQRRKQNNNKNNRHQKFEMKSLKEGTYKTI